MNTSQFTLAEEEEEEPITPPNLFTFKELNIMIKYNANPNKPPAYGLITGHLINEFPRKGIVMLIIAFNTILRLGYYPHQ